MKIFVTGGAGFLGRRVVGKLVHEGHSVRCLARPTSNIASLFDAIPTGKQSQVQIVRAQLSRFSAEMLDGCDAICHVAGAMKGSTAALFSDNVIATRRILQFAHAAAVRRVVLISSLAVYGTSGLRAGAVLDETCPLDERPHQRDPYTYSKLAGELLAWQAHASGQCPLVVVRPGVIYGAGRDPLSRRVGLSVGRMIIRMGSRQLLPYVHVEECAAGVVLAVTTPGIEGEAFNLVDTKLMTARDFLKVYRVSRPGLAVIPVPHWAIGPLSRLNVWYHQWSSGQLPAVLTPRKSQAFWKRLQYSNAKATAVLGWNPCPSTRVAICDLLRSQVEFPNSVEFRGQAAIGARNLARPRELHLAD